MINTLERKKIFLMWLFGSIILMLISALVSILIWDFLYKPELNASWQPLDDFLGMIYLVPVGWFFSFMTPLGWASLLFLAVSIYMKLPIILLGSALITLISGAFWPMTYAKMMVN